MRILLVEDEPDFLRTIAQALREEGYAVDAAQDGEEGLYKAAGNRVRRHRARRHAAVHRRLRAAAPAAA